MTFAWKGRAGLNLPVPMPCNVLPASAAGCAAARARWDVDQTVMMITPSTSVAWLYYPKADHYVAATSWAFPIAPGAGSALAWHPGGPTGTASAGTTTTLTSTTTTVRDLAGFKLRITGGPNAGEERTILHNTIGANAVFTVDTPFGTAITNASVYQLRTGRWYALIPGTLASGYFKSYDWATDTLSSLTITGLPATWAAAESRLIPCYRKVPLVAARAVASATGTTLTATGTAWNTNKWASSQVRIVTGTGAGQVRTIASNTGTVLTVSAAWTVNPDGTSTFVVEPNEDFIFVLGNSAVTMYRYSISGNSFTTISPGVARAAAFGAGGSGFLIDNQTNALWTNEDTGLNGTKIYSPRGGGSAIIDVYDLPTNAWSALTVGAETFTTGSMWAEMSGSLYVQKDATGRWFEFKAQEGKIKPFAFHGSSYASGAAILGDRSWAFEFVEDNVEVATVYGWLSTSATLVRIIDLNARPTLADRASQPNLPRPTDGRRPRRIVDRGHGVRRGLVGERLRRRVVVGGRGSVGASVGAEHRGRRLGVARERGAGGDRGGVCRRRRRRKRRGLHGVAVDGARVLRGRLGVAGLDVRGAGHRRRGRRRGYEQRDHARHRGGGADLRVRGERRRLRGRRDVARRGGRVAVRVGGRRVLARVVGARAGRRVGVLCRGGRVARVCGGVAVVGPVVRGRDHGERGDRRSLSGVGTRRAGDRHGARVVRGRPARARDVCHDPGGVGRVAGVRCGVGYVDG